MGSVDKLKNQLTAAVAMSAAALVASGYLITRLRLERIEAPTGAVLPALSTAYYIGVALEALLFLVILLLLAGVVFLLAQIATRTRLAVSDWPSSRSWLALGTIVAVIGFFFGGGPTSGIFSGGTLGGYPWAMLIIASLIIALAATLGTAGKKLELSGPGATAAAVLLLCTGAAVGFKLIDARLGAIAFPKAAAMTPAASCHTPDAEWVPEGCGFGGFFVGEDDNWIYLVQTPLVCPSAAEEPGRLLQVQRDEPFDVVISENLPTKPLSCADHESRRWPKNTERAHKSEPTRRNSKDQDAHTKKNSEGTRKDDSKVSNKSSQSGDHQKGSKESRSGSDAGTGGRSVEGEPRGLRQNTPPMPERD